MALTLWKRTGQLFWFVWCSTVTRYELCIFSRNATEEMLCSPSLLGNYVKLTNEVFFHHLSRLLHCKVTLFLFIINRYFVRRHFELHNFQPSNSQVIHLFVWIGINSWNLILFKGLWSTTIIIYYDAEIIPTSPSGSLVKLASVFYGHVPHHFLSTSCFLAQHIPGLSCAVFCSAETSHLSK